MCPSGRIVQKGETVLHWASAKGNKAIVAKLLESGANPDAIDAVSRTDDVITHTRRSQTNSKPIDVICMQTTDKSDTNAIKKLLKAGAL